MALAGSNRKPALTAAASKIGFGRASNQKLKEAPWQDRAWQVYEAEGSIYFMTRYRSAVARKIDYFAAAVDSPGDDPGIDATYNDDGELLTLGPAAKALELEGGPELIRRIVSELMVHWDVPGEAYLTRFDEDPFWRVLSTQELKKQGDTYSWGDDTFQQGTIDRDQVYRVWKPHPRFHWEPDSPTKHVLEDAEELILLRRELKARSRSRLPAGAWVLPDTVDFTPFGDDENGTEDDFAREMTNQMTLAVSDPGSAASLAPWILTVSPQDHPLVVGGFVRFDRDWDVNMEQREALLRSIATGLDVPPEILTGMADLNHWSAWLVSEQAVSQHVAPTVDDILDSLTTNWFRPLLEAASIDPDSYVLWRDLSPATVPPDKSELSLRLFEAGAISGVTLRRDTDHDEEDAPELLEGETVMDAAELLQRINAFGTLRRAGAVWDDAVKAVGLPPIAEIPGLLPITVRAEEVVSNEAPVVSAVMPDRKVLADVPARIDTDLLAWVVEAAHQEIERLLILVEDAALTSAADPLDESLLDSFADRLANRITQAQTRVKKWLEGLTGGPVTIPGQEVAAAAGVAAVVKAVLDAVRARLFTPQASPDPIDLGEIPEVAVPIKQIRDGLSLAGGGLPLFEGDKAWELIGNGKDTFDVLDARGFRTLSYRWDYGLMPRITEFPPHKALDQHTFPSWESADLTVHSEDSWLRRPYYKPGDHTGCGCSYVRVLTVSLPVPIAAAV